MRALWGATFRKLLCLFTLIAFMVVNTVPPSYAQNRLLLPQPGAVVPLSAPFQPALLKGVKVDLANPLAFDFVVGPGDERLTDTELHNTSQRLIKYFLATLTTPEEDMWVNLSPHEPDRIVPTEFGQTAMGRDLLAQDYLLKQITASLLHPDNEYGKQFWDKVYAEAFERYGTTEIPVDTFHKVWIMPDQAVVYEKQQPESETSNVKRQTRGSSRMTYDLMTHDHDEDDVSSSIAAFITKSRLKVLLEEDYVVRNEKEIVSFPRRRESPNTNISTFGSPIKTFGDDTFSVATTASSTISTEIMRSIVLPALETEVNTGKHFAQLRQIYSALILAHWYKKKLKDSILAQVYVDQNKIKGTEPDRALSPSASDPSEIYQRYLKTVEEGVFDFIRADSRQLTADSSGDEVTRRYFSGGFSRKDFAVITDGQRGDLNLDESRDLNVRTVFDPVYDTAMAISSADQDHAMGIASIERRTVDVLKSFLDEHHVLEQFIERRLETVQEHIDASGIEGALISDDRDQIIGALDYLVAHVVNRHDPIGNFIAPYFRLDDVAEFWRDEILARDNNPTKEDIHRAVRHLVDADLWHRILVHYNLHRNQTYVSRNDSKQVMDAEAVNGKLRELRKQFREARDPNDYLFSLNVFWDGYYDADERALYARQKSLLDGMAPDQRVRFAAKMSKRVARHLRAILLPIDMTDNGKFKLEHSTQKKYMFDALLNSVDIVLLIEYMNVLWQAYEENKKVEGISRFEIIESIYAVISSSPMIVLNRATMESLKNYQDILEKKKLVYGMDKRYSPQDMDPKILDVYFGNLDRHIDSLINDIKHYDFVFDPIKAGTGWHIGATFDVPQSVELGGMTAFMLGYDRMTVNEFHTIPDPDDADFNKKRKLFIEVDRIAHALEFNGLPKLIEQHQGDDGGGLLHKMMGLHIFSSKARASLTYKTTMDFLELYQSGTPREFYQADKIVYAQYAGLKRYWMNVAKTQYHRSHHRVIRMGSLLSQSQTTLGAISNFRQDDFRYGLYLLDPIIESVRHQTPVHLGKFSFLPEQSRMFLERAYRERRSLVGLDQDDPVPTQDELRKYRRMNVNWEIFFELEKVGEELGLSDHAMVSIDPKSTIEEQLSQFKIQKEKNRSLIESMDKRVEEQLRKYNVSAVLDAARQVNDVTQIQEMLEQLTNEYAIQRYQSPDYIYPQFGLMDMLRYWQDELLSRGVVPEIEDIRYALRQFEHVLVWTGLIRLHVESRPLMAQLADVDQIKLRKLREELSTIRLKFQETMQPDDYRFNNEALWDGFFDKDEKGLYERQRDRLKQMASDKRLRVAVKMVKRIARHLRSLSLKVDKDDTYEYVLNYGNNDKNSNVNARLNSVDYVLLMLYLNVLLEAYQEGQDVDGVGEFRILEGIYAGLSADPWILLNRSRLLSIQDIPISQANKGYLLREGRFSPMDTPDLVENFYQFLGKKAALIFRRIQDYDKVFDPEKLGTGGHIGSMFETTHSAELAGVMTAVLGYGVVGVNQFHDLPDPESLRFEEERDRFVVLDRIGREMNRIGLNRVLEEETYDKRFPLPSVYLRNLLFSNQQRATLAYKTTLGLLHQFNSDSGNESLRFQSIAVDYRHIRSHFFSLLFVTPAELDTRIFETGKVFFNDEEWRVNTLTKSDMRMALFWIDLLKKSARSGNVKYGNYTFYSRTSRLFLERAYRERHALVGLDQDDLVPTQDELRKHRRMNVEWEIFFELEKVGEELGLSDHAMSAHASREEIGEQVNAFENNYNSTITRISSRAETIHHIIQESGVTDILQASGEGEWIDLGNALNRITQWFDGKERKSVHILTNTSFDVYDAVEYWRDELLKRDAWPTEQDVRRAVSHFVDAIIWSHVAHVHVDAKFLKPFLIQDAQKEIDQYLIDLRKFFNESQGEDGYPFSINVFWDAFGDYDEKGLYERQKKRLESKTGDERVEFAINMAKRVGGHVRATNMKVFNLKDGEYGLSYAYYGMNDFNAKLNSADFTLLPLYLPTILEAYINQNSGFSQFELFQAIYAATSSEPHFLLEMEELYSIKNQLVPDDPREDVILPNDIPDQVQHYFQLLGQAAPQIAKDLRKYKSVLDPRKVGTGWHIGSAIDFTPSIELADVTAAALGYDVVSVGEYLRIPNPNTDVNVQEKARRFETLDRIINDLEVKRSLAKLEEEPYSKERLKRQPFRGVARAAFIYDTMVSFFEYYEKNKTFEDVVPSRGRRITYKNLNHYLKMVLRNPRYPDFQKLRPVIDLLTNPFTTLSDIASLSPQEFRYASYLLDVLVQATQGEGLKVDGRVVRSDVSQWLLQHMYNNRFAIVDHELSSPIPTRDELHEQKKLNLQWQVFFELEKVGQELGFSDAAMVSSLRRTAAFIATTLMLWSAQPRLSAQGDPLPDEQTTEEVVRNTDPKQAPIRINLFIHGTIKSIKRNLPHYPVPKEEPFDWIKKDLDQQLSEAQAMGRDVVVEVESTSFISIASLKKSFDDLDVSRLVSDVEYQKKFKNKLSDYYQARDDDPYHFLSHVTHDLYHLIGQYFQQRSKKLNMNIKIVFERQSLGQIITIVQSELEDVHFEAKRSKKIFRQRNQELSQRLKEYAHDNTNAYVIALWGAAHDDVAFQLEQSGYNASNVISDKVFLYPLWANVYSMWHKYYLMEITIFFGIATVFSGFVSHRRERKSAAQEDGAMLSGLRRTAVFLATTLMLWSAQPRLSAQGDPQTQSNYGGIDFDGRKFDVEVENEQAPFHIDAAMLANPESITGFRAIIVSITPINIPQLLGS